jgi:23S rRNA (guanine2445-N2)-methyltransferase / 23S rRNA (guanine2069-N7)-methyltransferase
MEGLLANELKQLGAADARESRAGVTFQGDLKLAYTVCLWSRIANRVLMPLASFPAPDPEALYQGVMQIDWMSHLDAEGSLLVDCSIVASAINHSQFAALKVKDAVCDQFRHETGTRPSVDRDSPDLRINVFLHKDQATVSIDLSGDSLHRRGYRLEGASAPLKENLAAAILARAGWPEIARQGGALVDPMCGSGTLPIEAAMMAADIAPGLLRDYWGFTGWKQHDPAIWENLVADASARREQGLHHLPIIRGYDINDQVISTAKQNAARIGLEDRIEFSQRAIKDCAPAPSVESRVESPQVESKGVPGLVVVNPPYGERLSEHDALRPVYQALGDCLKSQYQGWRAAVITSDAELGKCLGIRARQINKLFNGALECILLRMEIEPRWFMKTAADRASEPGAQMFANRLRKNLKQLARWRKQEGVTCFRCYDADMPEYAFAVDVYDTIPSEQDQVKTARWIVVQEYAAPAKIDSRKVQLHREQALAVLPEVFELPEEQVIFKLRERKRGTRQYEKQQNTRHFHQVMEGACRLWVNFEDYLDTGLFLDHRLTRQLIGQLAKDRTFLNLFAYTGAATVHAALGDEGKGSASSTTTVDMSRTYLDWAKRNMALNGLRGDAHTFEQDDCLMWIEKALLRGKKFGLIFLDPPTFSNSKRMQGSFDIQRDHVELLQKTAALLEPDGILIFSNNFRQFKMDQDGLIGLVVEDITRDTIPRDFERNARIHQCWKISRSN